ncbi:calcium-binding protein, partial [Azospirillum sp. TSO22-1]|uniref:calcium-binding protein n=1 Tax=Azospirillum sp. TSO22-1 TaxID=716789 RepID=UPI000D61BD2F
MPIPSPSAFLVTSETQVNTTVTGNQSIPNVATLAGGGSVVVWTTTTSQGYFQLYDDTGNKVGGEVAIGTVNPTPQHPLPVAALSGGGFVIGGCVLGTNVYGARVYSSTGQQTTTASIPDTAWASTKPGRWSVTGLPDNGFAMAFETSGVCKEQRFAADGTGTTQPFTIGQYSGYYAIGPRIAALHDGGQVAVWLKNGATSEIMGRIIAPNGTAMSAEFAIGPVGSTEQVMPQVAVLADGGFVVTWPVQGLDGSGWGIFARRYDAAGAAMGNYFQVNTTAGYDQTASTVTALADGGFAFAWTSSGGQDGAGLGVYAQRYDAAGNKVGSEARVAQTTAGNQSQVALSGRADGGWVAVWASDSTTGTGTEIYSRAYGTEAALPNGFTEKFGTAGNDVLTGTAGRDILYGLDGDDSLNGGLGTDSLEGGNGNDTLVGSAGNDTLRGGVGNDTYVVNDTGLTIVELAGEGNDTVRTSLAAYTLDANVENLVYTGTGTFAGTGNTLANSITGGAGADTLDGSTGSDTLIGGAGNDVYVVD